MPKHIFSIFFRGLGDILDESFLGMDFHLKDSSLWRRLVKVLRLNPDEEVALFDHHVNARVTLSDATFQNKNTVYFKIISLNKNTPIKPSITLACPILKREAFEEVVYFASVLGVKTVVPIITSKVHRKWGGDKELLRLDKIVISAAEQSKSFSLTKIEQPLTLDSFLKDLKSQSRIHFDANGEPFLNMVQSIKADNIVITLGPEGDLTDEERELLVNSNFNFVSLTDTVLKAQHAVMVGIGGIRSCL